MNNGTNNKQDNTYKKYMKSIFKYLSYIITVSVLSFSVIYFNRTAGHFLGFAFEFSSSQHSSVFIGLGYLFFSIIVFFGCFLSKSIVESTINQKTRDNYLRFFTLFFIFNIFIVYSILFNLFTSLNNGFHFQGYLLTLPSILYVAHIILVLYIVHIVLVLSMTYFIIYDKDHSKNQFRQEQVKKRAEKTMLNYFPVILFSTLCFFLLFIISVLVIQSH